MKNLYFIVLTLMTFCFSQAQIVNIPDANFKNTLVNSNCVDINGDGNGDIDADSNNDGEIQQAEAEAVIGLNVSYKAIHSLEGIQSFSNLEYLNCEVNQLTDLDLSQNTNLTILDCYFNNITSLLIPQSPNLIELDCGSNELSSLDISHNINLEILWFSYNQITSIDLTQNPNLKVLSCVSNQLTSLDVSENPLLEFLYCESNQLTNLELLNPNLEILSALNNQLTSLDISQSPNLTELRLIYNNLTSLDVSQNHNLGLLDCRDNQITNLDVSNLSNLTALFCSENLLTNLNIRNGNNQIMTEMIAINNPNLFCVNVDDVQYANAQICDINPPFYDGWCIDSWANYSENCILGTNNYTYDSISFYPNPVENGILHLEYNSELKVETLQIYNTLGELVITKHNNYQTIDISMLKSGIYFLKFKTKEKLVIKKIIKN
jgi:Leucine-rich repeat (LRR) protein